EMKNSASSMQGTSIKGISSSEIKSKKLFIPKDEEQQKIVSFLSLLDDRIQTQSKIIDKLKTLIQILRKKLLSQDLCFKDNNGNSYPNWETKKLRQLGAFFSGGTPLTTKRHYFDGNIPFIRSGEINASSTEQYISEEGLKNSSAKIVEIGDLIYALYGTTSGEVGISKIKGAINQAILCLRTDLNIVYLLNYLKFQKENILSTFLQGGQGNLSAEIIKSLKIPVPVIKEQAHIASILLNMDSKIELEINILKAYKNQKQYLLSNLFI
ncbi:restriction endonuclease subunit S, partial [Pedobacter borealis]|uniref:restriction endonuclease subunit S n=1 Tax=Pedobacter borealis TaxID=475254 RepID=UPI00049342D7